MKKSMFYTDGQGRTRYTGGSRQKQSTAQVKAVETAPTRKKAGFFFKDENGRTVFGGGPGSGGGGTSQSGSSDGKMSIAEMQKHVDKLSEEFNVSTPTVREGDPRTGARVSGVEIVVNEALVNDQSQFSSKYYDALPTSTREIITHEMGHYIMGELELNPRYDSFKMGGSAADRERQGISWTDSLVSKLDVMAKSHGAALSDYATKNAEEYFAEAFVAYNRGGSLRERIHPEVRVIFDKLRQLQLQQP
jgi:hypothetical protein